MFTFAGSTEVTWRRYAGTTYNDHGQELDRYEEEQVMVGLDMARHDEPRNMIDERELVDLVAFFPPGTKVDKRDRVVIDGESYAVEGGAIPLKNFFTAAMFHTEVKLRKVEG